MEESILKKKKFALNQPKQNSLKLYKALKSRTVTGTDPYRKYDAATFEGKEQNPKAPASYASFINLREPKSNPNNIHSPKNSGKNVNNSSIKKSSIINSLEQRSSKIQSSDVDEDFEFLPVRNIANSDTKSLFPEKSFIEVNLRYECFDLKCNSSLSFLNFSNALPTSEFEFSNSFAPCLSLTEKYFKKVRPLKSNINSIPTLKYNPDLDFPPDFKEMTEIEISLLQRMACGCKSLSWNEFEKMYLIQEKSEIKALENAPHNISDPLNSCKTFPLNLHKRKLDIRDSKFYRHKNSSANYAPNLKNKQHSNSDTHDNNKKQKIEEVHEDPLLLPYDLSKEMIDIEAVNYVFIDHEDVVTVEEDSPQEVFGVPKAIVEQIGKRLKHFRIDCDQRTLSLEPQLNASSQEPHVLSFSLEPSFTSFQNQINTNWQEELQFNNSDKPQQFNTRLQETQFIKDSQEKGLGPISCIFNKKGQLQPLSGGKENLSYSTVLRNFLKTKCNPLDSTTSSYLRNSTHSNITEERDILSRAISTIDDSGLTAGSYMLVEDTMDPIITDVTSAASTNTLDKSAESSDDIEILGESGPSFDKSHQLQPEAKIVIFSKWVHGEKSVSNEGGTSEKSSSNEGDSGKSLSNESGSGKSLSNESASVNPLPCIIPNKSLPFPTPNGNSFSNDASIENSLPNDTLRQTNVAVPNSTAKPIPPTPIIQFIADENNSPESFNLPPKPRFTPVKMPKPNIQLKRFNLDLSSFRLEQRNSTLFRGSPPVCSLETAESLNSGQEIALTPVSTSHLQTSHHNFDQNRLLADKPGVVTAESRKSNFKQRDNFVSPQNSTPGKTVSVLPMPLGAKVGGESLSYSARPATQHEFSHSSSSVGVMNKKTGFGQEKSRLDRAATLKSNKYYRNVNL